MNFKYEVQQFQIVIHRCSNEPILNHLSNPTFLYPTCFDSAKPCSYRILTTDYMQPKLHEEHIKLRTNFEFIIVKFLGYGFNCLQANSWAALLLVYIIGFAFKPRPAFYHLCKQVWSGEWEWGYCYCFWSLLALYSGCYRSVLEPLLTTTPDSQPPCLWQTLTLVPTASPFRIVLKKTVPIVRKQYLTTPI